MGRLSTMFSCLRPSRNNTRHDRKCGCKHSPGRFCYRRDLRVEALEDRRLLSVAGLQQPFAVPADSSGKIVELNPATGAEINGGSGATTFAVYNRTGVNIGPVPYSISALGGDDVDESALPGEIHGTKWNDLDGDGVRDAGEPGLSGWTVFVDSNNNRTLDAGETSTITDAQGNYAFTALAAGTYTVAEVMQTGWTQTCPGGSDTTGLVVNGGFETGTFSGWTLQNTDGSGTFVINNGSFDPSSPDGPLPPYDGTRSALSNPTGPGTNAIYQDIAIPADSHLTLRWADRIRNHATTFQDPNQEYRVEIRNSSNQVLATVFSTNAGDSLMNDWTARTADLSAFAGQTVRIAFVVQDSLNYFNVHIDDVRITSAGNNGAISVALADGQVVTGIDFGNRIAPSSEIHGAKWNDLDGDGVRDKGEPGLSGWTVFLDTNQNGILDSGERSTTTGADGSYSFTGLSVGTYTVAEVAQSGWTQTCPTTAVSDSLNCGSRERRARSAR